MNKLDQSKSKAKYFNHTWKLISNLILCVNLNQNQWQGLTKFERTKPTQIQCFTDVLHRRSIATKSQRGHSVARCCLLLVPLTLKKQDSLLFCTLDLGSGSSGRRKSHSKVSVLFVKALAQRTHPFLASLPAATLKSSSLATSGLLHGLFGRHFLYLPLDDQLNARHQIHISYFYRSLKKVLWTSCSAIWGMDISVLCMDLTFKGNKK